MSGLAATLMTPLTAFAPVITPFYLLSTSMFVPFMLMMLRSQMEDDMKKLDNGLPGWQYDFIVVGGGTAGCAVAARLSENPYWSVLVLEAGGEEGVETLVPWYHSFLPRSKYDYGYSTVPQKHSHFSFDKRKGQVIRGKVVGGTSSINAMLYMRGNRHDFNLWSDLGNDGWSYEEVLPYFLKSENNLNKYLIKTRYHRYGGPVTVSDKTYQTPAYKAFLKAGVEFGYHINDPNGYRQTGFSVPQENINKGTRQSGATAYLRPIFDRKNLHVSLKSTVLKVLVDSTNRAIGVVFERDGEIRTALARKEVILSAGAIDTPKLLMLSGIGPAHHLKYHGIYPRLDLPGVGKNLHDHPVYNFLVWTVSKGSAYSFPSVTVPSTVIDYKKNYTGPLSENTAVEGIAYLSSPYVDKYLDWPDIQLTFASLQPGFDDGRFIRQYIGSNDESVSYMRPLAYREGVAIFVSIQRPLSRGYIHLKDNSPYSAPLIDPNYFSHPHDAVVMVDALLSAIKLGESHAFKDIGAKLFNDPYPKCKKLPIWSRPYLECLARHLSATLDHHAGTCKMAPVTDPYGVVDPYLRVYGVDGLRVIDASIMPTPLTGNPVGAIYMIAEKGAHLIKHLWLQHSHSHH